MLKYVKLFFSVLYLSSMGLNLIALVSTFTKYCNRPHSSIDYYILLILVPIVATFLILTMLSTGKNSFKFIAKYYKGEDEND